MGIGWLVVPSSRWPFFGCSSWGSPTSRPSTSWPGALRQGRDRRLASKGSLMGARQTRYVITVTAVGKQVAEFVS